MLNPIRDIAASWGIDVAKELSDYAESLGIDINKTSISTDNPDTLVVPIDFAEAALLVQGSTSIYSRKVEHLYSLVYIAVTAMNQMCRKNKAAGDKADENGGSDPDADALLNIDEEDFLTLDDNIPQVDPKTITLPPEPPTSDRDETLLPPVPPMLAHTVAEASDHPGSIKYRMSTAHLHPSGALIMQGCPPVNENLDILPEEQGPTPENIDMTQPFDINLGDDVGDDDHGFMSPNGNDIDMRKTFSPQGQENYGGTPLAGSRTIKETAARYGITSSQQPLKRPRPAKDPFMVLDPHQEVPELEKALKVGKTYRKPRQKTRPQSKTTTYHAELPEGKNLFDILLPDIPQSVSIRAYVSFQGIREPYASILKKRRAQQRRMAMLEKDEDTDPFLGPFNDEDFENTPDVDNFAGDFKAGFDQDDGDAIDSPEHLRLLDDEDDSRDEHPDLDLFADAANELQLGSQLEYLASSYEETCRKHVEKTAWMWEMILSEADLRDRVIQWESRMQPLLEEEEQRNEFDISEYSETIMNKLDHLTTAANVTETQISKLLHQPDRYEISRLFLATLQLANNYTLEIVPPEGCAVSDFTVKSVLRGHRDKSGKTSDDRAMNSPDAIRLKRSRVPGSTPKSARRQPLRPRLEPQISAD